MSTTDGVYPLRLAGVRREIERLEVDALLVTAIDNIAWLTGFTGSHAFAIVTQVDSIIATDSRYVLQASTQCPGFVVHRLASSSPDEICGVLSGVSATRIGFEATAVTFQQHASYASAITPLATLVPTERIVEDLRLVKDAPEINDIRAACAVVDEVFAHVLTLVRPGVSERDLMLDMEWRIRKTHRAEVAFDSIVASGPRSALPHGRASERVINRGDLITFDFGARVNSYCSDITRTVVLGPATDRQRQVYSVVRDALEAAVAGCVAGAEAKAVDSIARDLIADAGFGDCFGHGLGHSLGRQVHDGPGLSQRSTHALSAGMVVTVEPGIYIPDWGGVRIEHDVVITDATPEVLTQTPIELLVL